MSTPLEGLKPPEASAKAEDGAIDDDEVKARFQFALAAGLSEDLAKAYSGLGLDPPDIRVATEKQLKYHLPALRPKNYIWLQRQAELWSQETVNNNTEVNETASNQVEVLLPDPPRAPVVPGTMEDVWMLIRKETKKMMQTALDTALATGIEAATKARAAAGAKDLEADPALDALLGKLEGETEILQKSAGSVGFLHKRRRAMKFYRKVIKGNFSTEDGSTIIAKTCLYFIGENPLNPVTRNTFFKAIVQAVEINHEKKKDVSERCHEQQMIVTGLLMKAAKDFLLGGGGAHIALTDDDTRHMINVLLMRSPKFYIPTEDLQLLQFVMLGQVTGRRTMERGTIAAASWTLKILHKGGKAAHVLGFQYCYTKGTGSGTYDQSFMSTSKDSLECDAIVVSLALFERRRMITSALAVYEGREELKVDPKIFETSPELKAKLDRAVAKAKPAIVAAIQSEMDGAGGYREIKTFMRLLCDEDENCTKIPMYCVLKNTLLTKKRLILGYNRTLKDFGESHGFRPKPKMFFGGTGHRKHYRQNVCKFSDLGSEFDIEAHMSMHASHSPATARMHYATANAHRSNHPANMFHRKVDKELARFIVENTSIRPAFDHPGFFKENWPKLKDPLPSAVEFLRLQEGEVFINCVCPACAATFFYPGDLREHINQCHMGENQVFWCETCEHAPFPSFKALRHHCHGTNDFVMCPFAHKNCMSYHAEKRSKRGYPPPGTAYFMCKKCAPDKMTNWYVSSNSAEQHLKRCTDDHAKADVCDGIILHHPPSKATWYAQTQKGSGKGTAGLKTTGEEEEEVEEFVKVPDAVRGSAHGIHKLGQVKRKNKIKAVITDDDAKRRRRQTQRYVPDGHVGACNDDDNADSNPGSDEEDDGPDTGSSTDSDVLYYDTTSDSLFDEFEEDD